MSIVALALMLCVHSEANAAAFTVTNTSNAGSGSLREAIDDANSNGPGLDFIVFNIPGFGLVHSITLSSQLPIITSSVNIDGTTQPGYIDAPLIEIDGNSTVADGLSFLSSGNNVIKGLVINRCNSNGIYIAGGVGNNVITSCYIGTDPTGTIRLTNNANGISIVNNGSNQIGGLGSNDGNIISGNHGNGISLLGSTCSNNTVASNYLGTNPSGDELGNDLNGLRIIDGSGNQIGGTTASHGNVIAYNELNGVLIYKSSATPINNAILNNAIYLNKGLGIDLGNDAVTLNDLNDADVGANGLQNWPVIDLITDNGTDTDINAHLNSTAGHDFRIDFFRNEYEFADPVYGEGQILITSTTINTDGSGNAVFTLNIPGLVLDDLDKVSATATRLVAGVPMSTSEFGLNWIFEQGYCNDGIDNDLDGLVDCMDPDCGSYDWDGDSVCDTKDLDDDNDGILDRDETASNQAIATTIGIGNNLVNSSFALDGTVVTYTVTTSIGNHYTYDAGLQGHSIRNVADGSTYRNWTITFSNPVSNLTFKIFDLDYDEDVKVYVQDENSLLYDLTREGLESIGSWITQSLAGARFVTSGNTDIDGDDPSNDNLSSVLFNFPEKVSQISFDMRGAAGQSIRISEMQFNVIDTDQDGIIDYNDIDSDNDGIYDAVESGSGEAQTAGVLNGAVDSDGIPLSVSNGSSGVDYIYLDTDADNILNPYDSDSDGDGCPDVTEAGFPDPDGDQQLGGLVPPTVDGQGVVTSGGL